MGAERAASILLRRLEKGVARATADEGRVILAFSGGLASLLVAATARKRVDVRCEVVGLPGSADAEAAAVAQSFLDYPVRSVCPTPRDVLRAARRVRSSNPRLTAAEAISLVPLALVEARHPRETILSGYGMTWGSRGVSRSLGARTSRHPGLDRRVSSAPSRVTLLGVAELLGIPESFSRAARRSPAEGSGVGPSLRALAHAEHTTVPRLLERLTPDSDYHERRAEA